MKIKYKNKKKQFKFNKKNLKNFMIKLMKLQ